jgi:hypothetical protein
MSALDRLRALEISREAPTREPSKPTKDPFDGFVGAPPPILPNIREVVDALAANDPAVDPAVERRKARALAMLDADPNRRVAVVAEAGDPAHVTVAIRGGTVGELIIPAERYDGFALLALMQQYGNA